MSLSQIPTAQLPDSLQHLDEWLSAKAGALEWPVLLGGTFSEDNTEAKFKLHVPANLHCFDGHFPNQPVLPGVMQIHWAGEVAKKVFNLSGFTALQGSKFNGMVLPDTHLDLSLQYKPEKQSVKYAYTDGQTKFSVGSLVFTECSSDTSMDSRGSKA